MKTLKLTDGDLAMENGALVMLEDTDEKVQTLGSLLRFPLGDWPEEPTKGRDWRTALEKPFDAGLVLAESKKALSEDSRVTKLFSFTATEDRATRVATVKFKVEMDGELLPALEVPIG